MLNNIKIGPKLMGGYLAVAAVILIVAGLSYFSLKSVNDGMITLYNDRMVPIEQLARVQAAELMIRGDVYKWISIPKMRSSLEKDMVEEIEIVNKNFTAYKATYLIQEEMDEIPKFESAWASYQQTCADVLKLYKAGDETAAQQSLIDGAVYNARAALDKSVGRLVQIQEDVAIQIKKESDRTYKRVTLLNVLSGILGLFLALVLSVILTRTITGPLNKAVKMIQEMGKGHLSERIHINRKDEIGILSSAMDEFAENLQKYVVKGMQQISEGNINIETPVMDDKDEIGPALKKMVENLKKLIVDFNQMYEIQKNGDFEYYMNVSDYTGAYKQVAEGYNEAVRLHVGNILKILGILSSYAEGDFNPVLEKLPGKQIIANEKMDTLRNNLQNLIKETTTLTKTASNGNLSVRADINKFGGDYTKIITGINDIMDAVIMPVNETASVMEKVASNDLSVRVKGDYKGDFAKIKDSINTAVTNLDNALQQVAIGADQVASASVQVSTGGQALSQGTSEQASSLEEVSSSLQEMSSMTKQNTANAKEAKGVADQTRESSEKGVESMSRLSSAINKIKASSDSTAKIVKTIDEIAFQTNLLALNAAVEAARAGDAGKGFAVVAEEVRNLAMRSAEAAKTTANLIEDAVKNSENGVAINAEVLKNFQEINERTNKVSQVVAEIAAASEQQDQGIGQVNKAVEQMNQVTQQNAANAEESASAAEEMSSQSEEMRSMVQGFKLTSSSDFNQALRASSQSGHMLHNLVMGKKGGKAAAGIQPDPRKIIPLDEKDNNILKTF